MKKHTLYRIARPILKIFISIYKPTIIGTNNIPKTGKCILAGNHTNNLDSILIISSTKRTIRFLAKKEMFKPILKSLFIKAGVIPVDRSNKDENAKNSAKQALENNELICIFPEGTINRTSELIMPFKYGTVSFANSTSSPIVPFVITGKYKIFRKKIKIKFLPAYTLETNDLQLENHKLMNIIKKELEENND